MRLVDLPQQMRKAWFDENSRGENGALRELALDDALWDQFNRDYDAWYAERPPARCARAPPAVRWRAHGGGREPAPRGGYYRWGEVLDHAEAGSMRRFARTDLLAEAGPVEEFSAESTPEAVADGITEVLTAPRCFDGSHMYAMVVWELPPPGAERPEDVAADDPARSTYIQCAGSTGVMTVEIRVTGQDGSYKHYVIAREPVADPESWMGIEWDPGEGGPAAVRVHPEEVFTGEQAAPVFRAYVVDGRLPAPELLRPLDI